MTMGSLTSPKAPASTAAPMSTNTIPLRNWSRNSFHRGRGTGSASRLGP